MEPRATAGIVSGADAPTPETYSPDDFLTPSQAKAAREKREAATMLTLKHTGGKALVRHATLSDVSVIGALPDKLQRRVLQMINDIRAITDTSTTSDDGSLDVDKTITLLKGDAKTIDIHCLIGFVKPRLIVADSDRTDPGEVVLSDIDPRDRKAVFDWMQGRLEQEAAQIAPFPEQPAADVAAGGPSGVDGAPPVGAPELALIRAE